MPELSERTKMILRLALLLAVTGAIGFLMYLLFFKSGPRINEPPSEDLTVNNTGSLPSANNSQEQTPGTTTPENNTGRNNLPVSPVADGGLTSTFTLTTSKISSPTVTANGDVTYYDPADGHFYSIDKNGNAKILSDNTFKEAENVTFSEGAKTAVLEFPDGSNIIYNLETSKQVSLPTHWTDFSFSSDSSQVASKSLASDPGSRALVITDSTGSSTKVIAALGNNDKLVDVNWSPDGSVVGFSRTGSSGSSFGQQEIYLLNPEGEAAGILVVSGTDFEATWSPDNTHLLYSVADARDDYRASLWYADKDGDRKGEARKAMPLKTLASKCTFATASVAYCAVPETMPAGGGSSLSLLSATPDNLYRLDLPSGRSTLAAIPAVSTQMFNLQINAAQDTLYYTDKRGRLNYLRLK